jgi:hypothetical protein
MMSQLPTGSSGEDREAVLILLGSLLRRLRGEVIITIEEIGGENTRNRISLPSLSLPRIAPEQPIDSPCSKDILRVLGRVGRRLTTTKLLSEMARQGIERSERKVSGELARLVEAGILDNPKVHGKHVGYGFPGWSELPPSDPSAG